MRNLILLTILVFNWNIVICQWSPIGGPYGCDNADFIQSDSSLFVHTSHGFYQYNEDIHGWNKVDVPIEDKYYPQFIAKQNNTIIVILTNRIDYNSNIYRMAQSDDAGASWQYIDFPVADEISGLVSNSYAIYLQNSDGVYLTTDHGHSWISCQLNLLQGNGGTLYAYDNIIFFTYGDFLYHSLTDKDEWITKEIAGDDPGYRFYAFDSTYFAVGLASGMLYLSSDAGNSWQGTQAQDWSRSNFIKLGDIFYGFQDDTIYRSLQGIIFQKVGVSDITGVAELFPLHDSLLIGASDGLILEDISLSSSKFYHKGIDASWVWAMCLDDGVFWTGVEGVGIQRTNVGSTNQSTLQYKSEDIADIMATEGGIYATDGSNHLLVSYDAGNTWSIINDAAFLNSDLWRLYQDENHIYVAGYNPDESTMFSRKKEGGGWNTHIISEIDINTSPIEMHQVGQYTFAVYENKIARRLNLENWTIVAEENHAYTKIASLIPGTSLIGYTDDRSVYPLHGTLHISEDMGTTWKTVNTDSIFGETTNDVGFFKAFIIDTIIIAYCGYAFESLYISHDAGESWRPFNQGLYYGWIDEFESDEDYIYANTYGRGIYRRKIEDLQTTSISVETNIRHNIPLYPNPNNGVFQISIPAEIQNNGKLYISDFLGRPIYTVEYNHSILLDIVLSTIPSGIYYVRLLSDGNIYDSKFLKAQ